MKLIRIFFLVGSGLLIGCQKPLTTPQKPNFPSKVGEQAPELEGGFTWLNSPAIRLANCRGKAVLLEFYDYSCVNCIRTFPYIKEWTRRYGTNGLVTIAVHSPQYGFSSDPSHVYTANKRLGVDWPVVVDSQWVIAEVYSNRFWPRILLIDKGGKIRFDHTGEGEYLEAEKTIQEVLREISPSNIFPSLMSPVRSSDKPGAVCYPITPELYLGTARGKLGNPVASVSATNTATLFHKPDRIEEGLIYAMGEWAIESEYLRHSRDVESMSDGLILKYRATELNVVMKPEKIFWIQVFIRQDGKWIPKEIAGADVLFDEDGRSFVKVSMPRMYNLVANEAYGTYTLELQVLGKGLSVYSYSFGTCEVPAKAGKLTPGME